MYQVFFDITSEVGGVTLFHPFMCHSASKNPGDFGLIDKKTRGFQCRQLDYRAGEGSSQEQGGQG